MIGGSENSYLGEKNKDWVKAAHKCKALCFSDVGKPLAHMNAPQRLELDLG